MKCPASRRARSISSAVHILLRLAFLAFRFSSEKGCSSTNRQRVQPGQSPLLHLLQSGITSTFTLTASSAAALRGQCTGRQVMQVVRCQKSNPGKCPGFCGKGKASCFHNVNAFKILADSLMLSLFPTAKSIANGKRYIVPKANQDQRTSRWRGCEELWRFLLSLIWRTSQLNRYQYLN